MSGLTDEQRYYLKFMKVYLNYNVDQVQNHLSMINPSTNKKYQKRSIKNWFDRLEQTGDVKKLPKTGRPRKLDKKEEKCLINTIIENPKFRFRKIRALGFRKIGIRSVNNYALRNKFSKFILKDNSIHNFICNLFKKNLIFKEFAKQ